MSFCDNGLLTNKCIMVFVPHPDDELNLMGGLLDVIANISKEVHIVYSTNGDYRYQKSIRLNEAINACKIFKIPFKNIHFLGYPDTPNEVRKHLFHSTIVPFVARNGVSKTSGINGFEDWNWKLSGQHLNFTRTNFVASIESIIQFYYPDLIFCTDFERHADHRCLSILFDEAIRSLLKCDKHYRPIIYKGFCYNTAYCGKNVYTVYNLSICPKSKLENPMYNWQDRYQFSSFFKTSLLLHNNLFKSLSCHKTQLAIGHAKSIIHSDQVFWIRRTDNLVLNATIQVSSGNPYPLNDFKIIDSDDIFKDPSENISFNKGIWFPDPLDIYPYININFETTYKINRICLYFFTLTDDMNIEVIFNNEKLFEFKNICIKEKGAYSLYFTDNIVSSVKIIFKKNNPNKMFGISEVEVFESYYPCIRYLSTTINDCNTNRYYISKDELIKLNVLAIDQKGNKFLLNENEITIIIDKKVQDNCSEGIIIKKFYGKKEIIVKLNINPELFNIIELRYINMLKRTFMEVFSNSEYNIFIIIKKWLKNKKIKRRKD